MLMLLGVICLGHFTAMPSQAQSAAPSFTQLVRKTMAIYFNHEQRSSGNPYQALIQQFTKSSAHQKPAGVFVTLSRQGRSRACWGSIQPQHNTIAESTVYATLGALTKDYRYRPITAAEWDSLKPQVTVIKALEPIENLHGQNPLRDGLMVRQGGKSGVILPGEAKDATYQLVQCKLKAGIRPGEPFQLYRIIADVYQ
jgi:AMMECR1 domain-containing protein